MYSLAIHFYAFIIALISPFHKKARIMRLGQWKTNSILREKIDRNAKYIWFHASSLGEFEQGRPMMEKIKAEHPEYKILLTFFSPSGYEVRKNYNGVDVICYLPFDTPYRVKKFLNLANPSIAVFIKYEFWGNYLQELKHRNIPVYIISSIFRRDQLFFQWFGYPYRKMLYCFTHLFVQDDRSAALLKEFGITNVTVTGDTRFDRVLDVRNQARELSPVEHFVCEGGKEKRLTLVAGSSWPQDEEILIPYFNEHPEMKLIIAPHEIHREHLMYIESLLKRPSVRLSDVFHDQSLAEGKDCLIVDSFGLLSSIYRYGTIAYIGGGFGAGIHNTLEAAVYGIPVLFGPKYHKFKEAKDLIKVGGGFSVSDKQSFCEKMDELLTYHEVLEAAGESAGQFVNGNAGATDKILRIIKL
ncbi:MULTISPECIES: 3-deoxy-D-manno-octulosonic acid transferase [Parabacteroides]|uniref:3-deoxy-D-manno-octulosonic acid transferase n=4 Tax=Parabacteroides goldsteinii TaxID=328812 RepID=A0A6G1ZGP2_9BACT|nr:MULTISPECIES: glycosyltransferase N-terminal domain-containing protein [Parabacteroides]EOS13144.1 3-deoxy-D-manno-octulosonic-acid transferase [Parabacteroides goldsteinii dnLKV18]KAI4362921.1 3-deoxy-D-manno-octulosonic acid transferase [Parabacteroides sp. ASF519]MBF0766792.1 3-deoxy-D-manno-octulosonic acid transferase [Parabacteroides goldsteinii]MDZ3926507.1 glycosyltransferase N-terminal domain-containing protein [Parabacteroides goldsteinii]MRX93587.1 3-deoxy-D-manno-octulosonic aci